MIVGIGVDLVSIPRMEAALHRRGPALAERLLSASEYREFLGSARKAHFLATRFAAREAALKALGTGLAAGIRWRDLEVSKDRAGAPQLQLHGAAALHAEDRGVRSCRLSLAHESEYALAFVVLDAAVRKFQ